MKKLFTIYCSAALLAIAPAHAQIVFNSATFNNVMITTDTLGKVTNSVPAMAPGPNQNIDMTGLAYENVRYYAEQFIGPNPFAQGNGFTESRGYEQAKLKFDSKRWSAVTANGLERFGEEIPRQAISLASVPGAGPNDSLIIPAQNCAYTTPYQLIKFPSTYQDQWSADFSYTVQAEINIPGLGYNNTPAQLKVRTQYGFEIVGWGRVDLILLNGTFGQSEVLIERISGTTTDSFFVNGVPANTAELAILGLTQNRTSKTYFGELLRVNEVTPLVLYNYGADPSFTNVSDARVHQLRVPFATSISNLTLAAPGDKVMVYPNPAKKDGSLSLYLPQGIAKQTNVYSYTISDIMGRSLGKGSIAAEPTPVGVTLPLAIPAHMQGGTYWISVYDGSNKLATTPFVLAD